MNEHTEFISVLGCWLSLAELLHCLSERLSCAKINYEFNCRCAVASSCVTREETSSCLVGWNGPILFDYWDMLIYDNPMCYSLHHISECLLSSDLHLCCSRAFSDHSITFLWLDTLYPTREKDLGHMTSQIKVTSVSLRAKNQQTPLWNTLYKQTQDVCPWQKYICCMSISRFFI